MKPLFLPNLKVLSERLNGKVILITGGTGSFGQNMVRKLLSEYKPQKIIIYSRDEYKQYHFKTLYPDERLRFFIGDVRDLERLTTAMRGVSVVFHAAALKHVDAIEYNPLEAVKTNIIGSQNVIQAAILNNVAHVIALSTDKCVNPANLYGATKLCSEKLFTAANVMSNQNGTIFSVLRYGNVLGSRGSVLPLFICQKESGVLTITSDQMTRFTITLDDAINFVLFALAEMIGGEIFVPKLPSYNIMELAKVVAPESERRIIGVRPGEKLHEKMISEDESYKALECDTFYVVKPSCEKYFARDYEGHYARFDAKPCQEYFSYSSGDNEFIDNDTLKQMIKDYVDVHLNRA